MTIEPDSSNPTGETPEGTLAEANALPLEQPLGSTPASEPEIAAPFEAEEEIEDEPEEDVPFAEPLEFIDESAGDDDLKYEWFILKVQVNREDSIKDALLRKVKMEGLDRFFKEVVVPTEDVAEFTKTGKRRVVKRKIYPGYVLVNMSVNDETIFDSMKHSSVG